MRGQGMDTCTHKLFDLGPIHLSLLSLNPLITKMGMTTMPTAQAAESIG